MVAAIMPNANSNNRADVKSRNIDSSEVIKPPTIEATVNPTKTISNGLLILSNKVKYINI
ncbi:hypothetical protein GCM10022392_14380 [Mucilaginibacter panaciglaebae]|uniref:Uncharacterized protein n=1 Tax=Mucilaginibacter panaciglaebae TaxID=502331 RepID=A0ABP7WPH0_9SPHI